MPSNRTTPSWISELRAAALPFVTRSLRGPRLKRNLALSLLLALVSCVLGAWIALGDGDVERDTRHLLRVEKSFQTRMHEDYVFFVHDPRMLVQAEDDRNSLRTAPLVEFGPYGGEIWNMAGRGHETLRAALEQPDIHGRHAELRARAQSVLDAHPHWESGPTAGRTSGFRWERPHDVARLQAIVDQDLVPAVSLYRSPLGPLEAVGVIGLVAGLLLIALATVVAPVLVGIAVAQEAHENTLQPLSGTSLSPRQIAIGLLVGAAAPVLIVAAPQLVLVVTASMIVGGLLPMLAFVLLLLACAWVLGTLAQAVGLHAGKRRGPGTIGITLLALVGTWAFAGLLLGLDDGFGRSKASVMALLPSGALVHFLREGLLGPVAPDGQPVDQAWFAGRLAAAAAACLVVGALALLATERRIFGRYCTPLRRVETMLGVGMLSVLTLLAGPGSSTETWLASLAMMVMPMQILLMGRVPIGDAPAGTARVQLGTLLGEFAMLVGIHAVIATVVLGPGWLAGLAPIGALQLGWGLAVAALVSIRVVAVPARLPALVWAGFAYVLAIVTFATGIGNIASHMNSYYHSEILFALWKASPMLGLVQAALTIAIPVLFVHALRRPARADAVGRGDA